MIGETGVAGGRPGTSGPTAAGGALAGARLSRSGGRSLARGGAATTARNKAPRERRGAPRRGRPLLAARRRSQDGKNQCPREESRRPHATLACGADEGGANRRRRAAGRPASRHYFGQFAGGL